MKTVIGSRCPYYSLIGNKSKNNFSMVGEVKTVFLLLWAGQHERERYGTGQSICDHEGHASMGEMEPEKKGRKAGSSGYH